MCNDDNDVDVVDWETHFDAFVLLSNRMHFNFFLFQHLGIVATLGIAPHSHTWHIQMAQKFLAEWQDDITKIQKLAKEFQNARMFAQITCAQSNNHVHIHLFKNRKGNSNSDSRAEIMRKIHCLICSRDVVVLHHKVFHFACNYFSVQFPEMYNWNTSRNLRSAHKLVCTM